MSVVGTLLSQYRSLSAGYLAHGRPLLAAHYEDLARELAGQVIAGGW